MTFVFLRFSCQNFLFFKLWTACKFSISAFKVRKGTLVLLTMCLWPYVYDHMFKIKLDKFMFEFKFKHIQSCCLSYYYQRNYFHLLPIADCCCSKLWKCSQKSFCYILKVFPKLQNDRLTHIVYQRQNKQKLPSNKLNLGQTESRKLKRDKSFLSNFFEIG